MKRIKNPDNIMCRIANPTQPTATGTSGATGNLGYGLGSLAILADINLLINRTNATLYTENKDIISHTAVEDENGNVLMSYGPDQNDAKRPNTLLGFAFRFRKSMSNYPVYKELPLNITINKYIFSLMRTVGNYLPYQGISINCVNMVSLSLWLNGIPNIGIHPYILYLSMLTYTNGIRFDLLSYYLTTL